MKELTKIIYNGAVYIPLRELTKVFIEESLYTIKKSIKEQGLRTTTIEGLGRSLFILESDVNKLIIDDKSALLKTKVTTLNDEVKMVSLLGLFIGENETTRKLQNEKIERFIQEPEYTVETILKENKKEHIEFNKDMEELGLGYRLVNINMKNSDVGNDGVVTDKITCLVDKDMSILGNTYDYRYEINNNRLYVCWNDFETGDLEEDYDFSLPLTYETVDIDRNKLINNLVKLVFSGDIKMTDGRGWFELMEDKFDLEEQQLILLMNKNTMITDIEIVA